MTDQEFGEEFLQERLQETASGEAALRQLRRRYDLLRQEYDRLLDRLERLERRVTSPGRTEQAAPAPLSATVRDPLVRLRDEYAEAAEVIETILRGLERITSELMPVTSSGAGRVLPTQARARETMRVQLEVRGGDFGRILDFQERLAAMEGVVRVSISAIDQERATLMVDLGS